MSGGVVVGIAITAVVLILAAGLSTLWVGGETSRKWSNRLMRYRVIAQAVAVLIIMIVLYFSSQH
jgi:ABC-type arginine transport system permease subunit